MKNHKLIIGYGNPLRGDDGLGWEIADRLAADITDKSVSVITVHQLTPELAEPVSEAGLVVFIDASYEGKPGSWRCDRVVPDNAPADALGHHFNIPRLLDYAREVYHATPEAWVVSIAAESFDCHDKLTRTVRAALPEVVRFVREQIISQPTNREPAHA